jgi:hypothetical protein
MNIELKTKPKNFSIRVKVSERNMEIIEDGNFALDMMRTEKINCWNTPKMLGLLIMGYLAESLMIGTNPLK